VLRNPDGVERDIDRHCLADHRIEVGLHGLLVERVDLRGLRRSPSSRDFLRECIDGAEVSRGQKDTSTFASERTGHRAPTAPPAP
jgi:hypothetical protein